MASAKAKKKRKMRRKLAKKKKKLKLTEPLKEAEREASMLRQLRLAMAKFDSKCSQGKIGLQDEMDLSADGESAKVLRGERSSRQTCDPTTSDVGASQFRANQFRRTSANSNTPKVEQQLERHFGRRAPPPQKLDSVNRPIKTAAFSPRPLAPMSLPSPAISPVPTPNSRRLIALKPQLLLPVTGAWSTTIWMKVASTFKVPELAAFLKSAFTPPSKPKKRVANLLPLRYHQAVTVHRPSVPPPQPAAEAQAAEPPRSSPDSQPTAKQPAPSTKKRGNQGRNLTDEAWYNWQPDPTRLRFARSTGDRNKRHFPASPHNNGRARSRSVPPHHRFYSGVRQDTQSSTAAHQTREVEPNAPIRRYSESHPPRFANENQPMEVISVALLGRLIQTVTAAPESTVAATGPDSSRTSGTTLPLVVAIAPLTSLQ